MIFDEFVDRKNVDRPAVESQGDVFAQRSVDRKVRGKETMKWKMIPHTRAPEQNRRIETNGQEGKEADDHTAGALILHLSGPAYSRRSRVAQ